MVMLRNAADAWVDETRPTRPFSRGRRLYVKAAGSNQRFAYIYFARPFPLGATILSAKLRVYNGTSFEGTATLSVNTISEKWSKNRVNWNNKPAVYATTRTLTKTDAAPGTEWEIDVAPVLQNVSNGGKWFGFRITTNDGIGEWFHSAQSKKEEYRPTLEITWTMLPDAPEELSPGGGRAIGETKPLLHFTYGDDEGESEIQAVRIQMASSQSNLLGGTYTFDSGEVPAESPEFDLLNSAAPAATAALTWWRAQVKNAAGKWSPWSDPESYYYLAKGVVTLQNPPDVPGSTVEDSTPPIFWTFSGTQVSYQIIIAKANQKGKWLWTSRKVTSTAQDVTLPDKILKRDDEVYNVRVRIWDDKDREKTSRETIYAQVSRDFTFNFDPTTDPVTNLIATAASPYPWMTLEWDRFVGAPDRYQIWRGDAVDDMEIVDIVDSDDVFVAGVHYKYDDRFARGRTKQYWKVVPVVNEKASSANTVVNGTPRGVSRWLMDIDGSDPICIANPAVDMARAESSEVHRVLGNRPPVLITQSIGGDEGTVSGILSDGIIPGLSARTMMKRFKRLRENAGQDLIFFNVDQTIPIFMRNARIRPRPVVEGRGVDYEIEFEFYETGY